MGTTQKNNFRSFATIAMATMINGGKFMGRKFQINESFNTMFGNKGYSGSPRLMLTLQPDKPEIICCRDQDTRDRKRSMRREKRARINARGFC